MKANGRFSKSAEAALLIALLSVGTVFSQTLAIWGEGGVKNKAGNIITSFANITDPADFKIYASPVIDALLGEHVWYAKTEMEFSNHSGFNYVTTNGSLPNWHGTAYTPASGKVGTPGVLKIYLSGLHSSATANLYLQNSTKGETKGGTYIQTIIDGTGTGVKQGTITGTYPAATGDSLFWRTANSGGVPPAAPKRQVAAGASVYGSSEPRFPLIDNTIYNTTRLAGLGVTVRTTTADTIKTGTHEPGYYPGINITGTNKAQIKAGTYFIPGNITLSSDATLEIVPNGTVDVAVESTSGGCDVNAETKKVPNYKTVIYVGGNITVGGKDGLAYNAGKIVPEGAATTGTAVSGRVVFNNGDESALGQILIIMTGDNPIARFGPNSAIVASVINPKGQIHLNYGFVENNYSGQFPAQTLFYGQALADSLKMTNVTYQAIPQFNMKPLIFSTTSVSVVGGGENGELTAGEENIKIELGSHESGWVIDVTYTITVISGEVGKSATDRDAGGNLYSVYIDEISDKWEGNVGTYTATFEGTELSLPVSLHVREDIEGKKIWHEPVEIMITVTNMSTHKVGETRATCLTIDWGNSKPSLTLKATSDANKYLFGGFTPSALGGVVESRGARSGATINGFVNGIGQTAAGFNFYLNDGKTPRTPVDLSAITFNVYDATTSPRGNPVTSQFALSAAGNSIVTAAGFNNTLTGLKYENGAAQQTLKLIVEATDHTTGKKVIDSTTFRLFPYNTEQLVINDQNATVPFGSFVDFTLTAGTDGDQPAANNSHKIIGFSAITTPTGRTHSLAGNVLTPANSAFSKVGGTISNYSSTGFRYTHNTANSDAVEEFYIWVRDTANYAGTVYPLYGAPAGTTQYGYFDIPVKITVRPRSVDAHAIDYSGLERLTISFFENEGFTNGFYVNGTYTNAVNNRFDISQNDYVVDRDSVTYGPASAPAFWEVRSVRAVLSDNSVINGTVGAAVNGAANKAIGLTLSTVEKAKELVQGIIEVVIYGSKGGNKDFYGGGVADLDNHQEFTARIPLRILPTNDIVSTTDGTTKTIAENAANFTINARELAKDEDKNGLNLFYYSPQSPTGSTSNSNLNNIQTSFVDSIFSFARHATATPPNMTTDPAKTNENYRSGFRPGVYPFHYRVIDSFRPDGSFSWAWTKNAAWEHSTWAGNKTATWTNPQIPYNVDGYTATPNRNHDSTSNADTIIIVVKAANTNPATYVPSSVTPSAIDEDAVATQFTITLEDLDFSKQNLPQAEYNGKHYDIALAAQTLTVSFVRATRNGTVTGISPFLRDGLTNQGTVTFNYKPTDVATVENPFRDTLKMRVFDGTNTTDFDVLIDLNPKNDNRPRANKKINVTDAGADDSVIVYIGGALTFNPITGVGTSGDGIAKIVTDIDPDSVAPAVWNEQRSNAVANNSVLRLAAAQNFVFNPANTNLSAAFVGDQITVTVASGLQSKYKGHIDYVITDENPAHTATGRIWVTADIDPRDTTNADNFRPQYGTLEVFENHDTTTLADLSDNLLSRVPVTTISGIKADRVKIGTLPADRKYDLFGYISGGNGTLVQLSGGEIIDGRFKYVHTGDENEPSLNFTFTALLPVSFGANVESQSAATITTTLLPRNDKKPIISRNSETINQISGTNVPITVFTDGNFTDADDWGGMVTDFKVAGRSDFAAAGYTIAANLPDWASVIESNVYKTHMGHDVTVTSDKVVTYMNYPGDVFLDYVDVIVIDPTTINGAPGGETAWNWGDPVKGEHKIHPTVLRIAINDPCSPISGFMLEQKTKPFPVENATGFVSATITGNPSGQTISAVVNGTNIDVTHTGEIGQTARQAVIVYNVYGCDNTTNTLTLNILPDNNHPPVGVPDTVWMNFDNTPLVIGDAVVRTTSFGTLSNTHPTAVPTLRLPAPDARAYITHADTDGDNDNVVLTGLSLGNSVHLTNNGGNVTVSYNTTTGISVTVNNPFDLGTQGYWVGRVTYTIKDSSTYTPTANNPFALKTGTGELVIIVQNDKRPDINEKFDLTNLNAFRWNLNEGALSDKPILTTKTSTTISVGTGTGKTLLSAIDEEMSIRAGDINRLVIKSLPVNGTLLGKIANADGGSFVSLKVGDITDGEIRYQHNGHEVWTDQFTFDVMLRKELNSLEGNNPATMNIIVAPRNDNAPILENRGIFIGRPNASVDEQEPVTITAIVETAAFVDIDEGTKLSIVNETDFEVNINGIVAVQLPEQSMHNPIRPIYSRLWLEAYQNANAGSKTNDSLEANKVVSINAVRAGAKADTNFTYEYLVEVGKDPKADVIYVLVADSTAYSTTNVNAVSDISLNGTGDRNIVNWVWKKIDITINPVNNSALKIDNPNCDPSSEPTCLKIPDIECNTGDCDDSDAFVNKITLKPHYVLENGSFVADGINSTKYPKPPVPFDEIIYKTIADYFVNMNPTGGLPLMDADGDEFTFHLLSVERGTLTVNENTGAFTFKHDGTGENFDTIFAVIEVRENGSTDNNAHNVRVTVPIVIIPMIDEPFEKPEIDITVDDGDSTSNNIVNKYKEKNKDRFPVKDGDEICGRGTLPGADISDILIENGYVMPIITMSIKTGAEGGPDEWKEVTPVVELHGAGYTKVYENKYGDIFKIKDNGEYMYINNRGDITQARREYADVIIVITIQNPIVCEDKMVDERAVRITFTATNSARPDARDKLILVEQGGVATAFTSMDRERTFPQIKGPRPLAADLTMGREEGDNKYRDWDMDTPWDMLHVWVLDHNPTDLADKNKYPRNGKLVFTRNADGEPSLTKNGTPKEYYGGIKYTHDDSEVTVDKFWYVISDGDFEDIGVVNIHVKLRPSKPYSPNDTDIVDSTYIPVDTIIIGGDTTFYCDEVKVNRDEIEDCKGKRDTTIVGGDTIIKYRPSDTTEVDRRLPHYQDVNADGKIDRISVWFRRALPMTPDGKKPSRDSTDFVVRYNGESVKVVDVVWQDDELHNNNRIWILLDESTMPENTTSGIMNMDIVYKNYPTPTETNPDSVETLPVEVFDRAAPVVDYAKYYRSFAGNAEDILVVKLSETAKYNTANIPFYIWKPLANEAMRIGLRKIDSTGTEMTFALNYEFKGQIARGDFININHQATVRDIGNTRQDNSANIRRLIDVEMYNSIVSAAYFDTSSLSDGYIDLIKVYADAGVNDKSILSALKTNLELPEERGFIIDTVKSAPYGFDVYVTQDREKAATANTGVDSEVDVIKLTKPLQSADGIFTLRSLGTAPITDSVRAVISVAELVLADKDTTLTVRYSEPVTLESGYPYLFFDTDSGVVFNMEFALEAPKRVGANAYQYRVTRMDKSFPRSNDKISVVRTNFVRDASYNITDSTVWAPLKVTNAKNIEVYDWLKVFPSPVWLSSDRGRSEPKVINPDMTDYYGIQKDTRGVAFVLESVSELASDLSLHSGKVLILDQTGNAVSHELKMEFGHLASKRGTVTGIALWDCKNVNGRLVGAQTYVAVIELNLTLETEGVQTKITRTYRRNVNISVQASKK